MTPTDNTKDIFNQAKLLLRELYKNQSIRLIGMRVDNLTDGDLSQISLFENNKIETSKLDKAMDKIKDKYGYNSITLAGKMNMKDIKTD